MKQFWDICTKETYTSQGKEVTKWHQVGKLMEDDKGRLFLNIPLLPKLFVFEQKEKNAAHAAARIAGDSDPF